MSLKNVDKENRLFCYLCIILLCLIYIFSICTLPLAKWGEINFLNIGPLSIPSLAIFIGIFFLAIWKRKFYFIFLIFIILAFPSPIDDIFPSIPLTNTNDRTQVVFPLFTRIDIYLILGIVLKLFSKNFKFPTIQFTLTLKIFFLLFLFIYFSNTLNSKDLWDFNLLLSYSFHIRYFILFLLLVWLYDIRKYEKQIVISFIISIFFLLFEAMVNTVLKGSPRLLSGSLSLNTFANISAAIGLYMFFLIKNGAIKKLWGYLVLIAILIILIGSGTRGAILSMIISYFGIYLIKNHRKFLLNFLKVSFGIFFIGFLYVLASNNDWVPERYSLQGISKKIEIDPSKNNLTSIIKIKITAETTSIKSRLDLFESSLNMINENPWSGIGAGRWNRYKNEYSNGNNVPKVLLDSHNDYLALAAQYGLPLGLVFAYVIFLYPMILHKRTKHIERGALNLVYIINFVMAIAAFSNAGFFKHQVSAVMIFCLCVTLKQYRTDGQQ